jgi:hypothetical protein
MRFHFIFALCLALAASLPVQAQTPTPEAGATPQPTVSAPASDKDLESELAKQLGASSPTPTPAPPPAVASAGALRLIDVSFDGLFAAGFSSAKEDEIDVLQGGGHDPKQNGFTVQNVELSFLGAVDPYLRGESHVVLQIDKQGETSIELEEAFLTTQTLPAGLQVKAGQFFTEFGRLNPTHPHTWFFVDQPVINSRLFGEDGLRGPGVRLSWLTPLPWYSELLFAIQNARGATQFSFLGSDAEPSFDGYPFVKRPVNGLEDLLYTVRSLNSFSLSEASTLNLGASGAFGPNATGSSARTTIVGADAYLKWQKPVNYQGYPFVGWQSEVIYRKYGVGPTQDPATGQPGFETDLKDWGLYSQLVWGFRRGWVAGARVDYADGNGMAVDPLRDRRLRFSADLSYYPTEFSKLRVQYNLDRAQHLDDDLKHSIWLQFEFLLGAHGAHKF